MLHEILITAISTSNVLFPHNNVNSCFRNTFLLHKDYSTSAIESVKELPHDSAIDNVNHLLKNYEEGRLFAIVHICGKQFRVVEGDIIVIEGYWPPDIGDKISLDKVIIINIFDTCLYVNFRSCILKHHRALIVLILFQILLAGSADFSLIGRPLVKKDLVKVTATIIEKTLSHTKTVFKKKRRKQFMRINCKSLY